MSTLPAFADWLTQRLQSGSLHAYLSGTIITTGLAVAASLWAYHAISFPRIESIDPIIILPVLMVVAAIAVVRADSFISGIMAAGIVGFLMSLLFLFQGAPDLAFTQFSVEALSIVILLTVVGRMPFQELEYRTKRQRRQDAVVAAGFGTAAALVLISIVASPFNGRLSEYYKTASLLEAHGRNIVNVIIVDFRGVDTLGEITVLTLAGIAVSALLIKIPSGGAKRVETPGRPEKAEK